MSDPTRGAWIDREPHLLNVPSCHMQPLNERIARVGGDTSRGEHQPGPARLGRFERRRDGGRVLQLQGSMVEMGAKPGEFGCEVASSLSDDLPSKPVGREQRDRYRAEWKDVEQRPTGPAEL